MSQRNSTDPSGRRTTRTRFGFVLCLCAAAISLQACAPEQGFEEPVSSEADLEAVEIWAHPDTAGINVYAPLDFKAASRSVVWAIDGVARGVMRYEPSEGKHGVFGFVENPPAQVVSPARLAVAENTGLFVFDDSTGMVDLYSPGGQHLRGFDPGVRPSILEVSRRPLRLTYGVRAFADDSIPTLAIIQTNFLGQNPDTLLSPDVGPETLRGAPAVRGSLVSTPSIGGLWVFSKAASDTVFEVSGTGPSRKLALPEADTLRAGILADLQQEILWVVAPRPTGGLEYEAYDISGPGDDGVINGTTAYLGVRTTPLYFLARVTFDGSVSGWWRGDRGVYAPKGYDMRVDELRDGAPSARATRVARRAATANLWVEVLQAVEEAKEEARREDEEVRAEEELD
ncbi:MAG: hypothetical protein KAJ43_09680 [Gemmatimonadetes bacterium]|nr:hypothetical protein [Gemmatimonadota bacterium]